MTRRSSDHVESIVLIAATAFLVIAAQRYFEPPRPERIGSGHLHEDHIKAPPEHARERRGRTSVHPLQIPWRGWKDILWRTYGQIGDDRLLATAAGVVFFGLLAVFPAITALVSSYGLFADPSTIGKNLQDLALMLPEGSFAIVQDQIARVLGKGPSALSATFLFGLALAIWSANAGVKAVIEALNVVYGEREKRSFIRLNLVSLAFTVGAIAALMLMVAGVIALPLVIDRLWMTPGLRVALGWARWPFLLCVLIAALAVLYRFGPSRQPARWEWLSVGTLAAAFSWIAGSALLSWYLSNFGNYTATYGSLGAAIGLMMWMWLSSIIVLCGAELNSEIEHQTAEDTTTGPPKPLGARGAKMADTVGQAYT